MDIRDIEQKVRRFIDDAVLDGQGSDLTPTTSLFDLGILDSFTVLSLMNFLEKEFGVGIQLESLASDDFKDVASIAQLVQARQAAAPRA